jgi:ethanolamine permease
MSERRKVGSVTYEQVGEQYFAERGLRRHAAFWSLWSLGVAAVISGDFYGWNAGLAVGGFGGLLIATAVVAVMYYGLCFSIAEMSPALPHTGGAYSFARSATGPWGGFITGLAENMEYVITPAVVVGAMGFLMHDVMAGLLNITGEPWWNSYVTWTLVFYVIFVYINIIGIEATMRFTVVINILALAILAFFFIAAIVSGDFHPDLLTNIPPESGGSSFLPFGISGIFPAIPFAIWFFLAIEELPLAAEESHDPVRDIPKAGFWARGTLIVTGLLVLFLNTGVIGAEATGVSAEPLLDGFRAIVGDQLAALLALFALVGLLASLQGIMFAYGRNMYSLSRAGYYPKFLSLTGKRQTPWVALTVGAAVGFIALVILETVSAANEGAGAVAGAIVLNIAVWGAVLAYLLQMISFIILRRKFPNANRPYVSPWGITGAVIAAVIAALIFVGFLLNPTFVPAIIAIAIVYVVILVGFALFFRHRLVLSPEEEYALSGGRHWNPEEEGYDAMEKEVFGDKP